MAKKRIVSDLEKDLAKKSSKQLAKMFIEQKIQLEMANDSLNAFKISKEINDQKFKRGEQKSIEMLHKMSELNSELEHNKFLSDRINRSNNETIAKLNENKNELCKLLSNQKTELETINYEKEALIETIKILSKGHYHD